MGILLFVLAALLLFESAHSQVCPTESGWVTNEQRCYNFKAYPRLDAARAIRYCQDNGATLLSVNSPQEHQFINNWLIQNDKARDQWLTSGVNTNQGIRWDDGAQISAFENWIIPVEQRTLGQHIIYSYHGAEYGWNITSPSQTYAYICEISINEVYRILQERRDFDYGTDVDNPGLAPRGPVFIREPEDTIILISKARSAYLECLASGNPEPSYEWLVKVRGIMTPVVRNDRFSFTSGRLDILSPKKEDENTYQCRATNKFGTVLSSPVALSFGQLGDFNNVPSATVNGYEYDGIQLECPGIDAKPGKSYQWYKDKHVIIRPDQQTHIFISSNGRLYFSELTVSDEGTYFCIVTLTDYGMSGNDVLAVQSEMRNSPGFNLRVTSGGANNYQPRIQNDFIYVFPPTPMRGKTLRLECCAYGTGPLRYTWLRADNKPLPRGHRFESQNRVLILNNVEIEDGGTYICKVYSLRLNLGDERSTIVLIQSKPYFTVPLTPQHVDIGSHLTWYCRASGQPVPTYTWYKNGIVLNSTAGITVNANTLTIDSVDPKRDNGMYQCAATNSFATTFSTAQLRALELAPSFTKTPMVKSMASSLRGNVTIICNPVAAPVPEYKWSKDGSFLNLVAGQGGPDDHYRLLQNGNLIIQNVVDSDRGKYTCRAENRLGAAEDYSDLRVVDRTVITQAPSDQRVEVNMTATLLCRASHPPDVDLIYIWVFNDHVIEYNREPEYRLGDGVNKGSLYIMPSNYKNEGLYTCIATTGMDQQSAKAYLTVLGPPGEPAGVLVSEKSPIKVGDQSNQDSQINENTSRWIIWTDGDEHGSQITHYFVEFSTNFDPKWRVHPDGNNVPLYEVTNTQYPTKRFVRLNNLKAGAGIQFRVKARNNYGIGVPSLPTTLVTIPGAKPSVNVTNVRGGGGSVGDLTIVWDPLPLEDHNGPNLKYRVSWRTFEASAQSDNSKWRRAEISDEAACVVKVDYVSLRGQYFLCSYVVTVGSDNFYKPYSAEVQPFNDFGNGPSAYNPMIMSAEGMPLGAPENVNARKYNSTALMITWTPVSLDRASILGVLKGYKINYWRMGPETESEALQNIIDLKPWQTNLKQSLIIGLEPMTWYSFNVQCYNSAGNGPKSSTYHRQTLNKVPELYPTEVYVYSIEGFGVRVNFRGVSTQAREEPLMGYMVQYWKANENILSAKLVDFGKSHTGVIRNLTSSVLYQLRIYGYSRGGQGKRSSPSVYFTVGDGLIQFNPETTEVLSGQPAEKVSAFILLIAACVTLFVKV